MVRVGGDVNLAVGISAPAEYVEIMPQGAGVIESGRDRMVRTAGRHRQRRVVAAPAQDYAVSTKAARVVVPGANAEEIRRWRGRLAEVVRAPARNVLVRLDRAGMEAPGANLGGSACCLRAAATKLCHMLARFGPFSAVSPKVSIIHFATFFESTNSVS